MESTTTAGAVEQLAMARRIAADIWERRAMAWRGREGLPDNPAWRASTRNAWERGDYDAEDGVQAALAAITETRAHLINSLRHDFDEWTDYVALADVADALERPWA